jgi:riboflavin kinase/FMN adenylyltransferase
MQNFFSGTVVQGFGRGKEFGFPTVNIKLNDNELYIENGVYAVTVTICRGMAYPAPTELHGMLYVGTRPTLDLQETTIEIHILDFDRNLYHHQISFQIIHKIRDEIRFDSVEKLIEQLHQDMEMVYNFFNSRG